MTSTGIWAMDGRGICPDKDVDLWPDMSIDITGSLPMDGFSSRAAVLIVYVMAFAKANSISLEPFEVVRIVSVNRRGEEGVDEGHGVVRD